MIVPAFGIISQIVPTLAQAAFRLRVDGLRHRVNRVSPDVV